MTPTSHPLLTAAQLGAMLQAARIGLSQSRVSHLELNAQALSVEQLRAWCAALGLELAVGARDKATMPTTTTDW